jgi:hypothetical protein
MHITLLMIDKVPDWVRGLRPLAFSSSFAQSRAKERSADNAYLFHSLLLNDGILLSS